MKRKLLKQIGNEWRSNLWLMAELLIISSVLWFIFDYAGTYMSVANQPVGLDTDHVYTLSIQHRSEDSPYYETPPEGENEQKQVRRVMRRLAERPEIEAVCTGSTAPYNYNFWGEGLTPASQLPDSASLADATLYGRNNRILASPEYAEVFRMRGIHGETPEQLRAILEEGKIIVTSNAAGRGMTPDDLMNMNVYMSDSTNLLTIGAVIGPLKRSVFEPVFHSSTITPIKGIRSIYFRVKADADRDFKKKFLDEIAPGLNYGNAYVADISSLDEIREQLHRSDYADLRNMYICMGFLLLTVFLGILGTFWFRTQQRTHELAIRLTVGASRTLIFKRLISEGLLLLVLVTPFAVGIDAVIEYNNLTASSQYFEESMWMRTFVEAAVVFVCMAVMIVAGIAFPAAKAMKVEPAAVLAGE